MLKKIMSLLEVEIVLQSILFVLTSGISGYTKEIGGLMYFHSF